MYRYLILVLLTLLGCSSPIECRDETCSQDDDQMHGSVPGVPLVQVLPKMGWSQGADFQPGSGITKSVMQQKLPEAGNYTLQFNVIDPNNANNLVGGDLVQAKAIITWKVNGNPVTRIVDCGDGVSVTGVAESVDVAIQDVSSPGNIITRALPYTVTVTCAPGTRAAVQQPPINSLGRASIAPGASQTFDVPQNSGVISAMVVVAPGVGGTIGAYQVLVQHFAQGTPLKTYDPRQSDWVPLMPGTTQIRVVCDAALLANTLVQVTFGIDG